MSALLHHRGRPAWGRFIRRLAGWPMAGHRPRPRHARLGCEALEDRIVPDGRPQPFPIIATGSGLGSPPLVKVFDAVTGALKYQITPYDSSFLGGVRVATADLTGDGFPDIITAPGPGGGPHVRVFDGQTGQPASGPLGSFYAYEPLFIGGVYLAAGDFNGDGRADLVTAADAGGGPHVKVFSGADGSVLASFYAFDPDFAGGVRVAAADFTGDGKADLVLAAGPGGGPHVKVLDATTLQPVAGPYGSFYAYDPGFRGGVFVATGDLTGTGVPDLITGPGIGHPPQVRMFDVTGSTDLGSFSAFDASDLGGVRVASTYVDDDNKADVVVATGLGEASRVRVFGGTSGQQIAGPVGDFAPFDPSAIGGVSVAAAADPGGPVTFLVPSVIVNENIGQFWMLISVAGPTTFTVADALLPGDMAIGGTDFTVFSQNVGVASGQTLTAIPITILDDGDSPSEGDVTFHVNIGTVDFMHGYFHGTYASLKVTIHEANDLPPDKAPDGGCVGGVPPMAFAQNVPGGAAAVNSQTVRYGDGMVRLSVSDISSDGFGLPFGQGRTWTNATGFGDAGFNGSGWLDTELPSIHQADGNQTLYVEGGSADARYFDLTGSTYQPRHYEQMTLVNNTAAGEFDLTDADGTVTAFYDFSGSRPAAQRGRFKGRTDAAGNAVSVTSSNTDGKPTEIQRTDGTVTESFLATYVASGANAGLMATETLRRKVGAGSWFTVRQVVYTYYDGVESNGNAGDLKTAQVEDASGTVLDTSYYRYYVAGESNGYQHGLKYALGPEAYDRMAGTVGSPLTASDSALAPYADHFYQFDSQQRVTEEVASAAGCSVCSGGQGTYTFAYTTQNYSSSQYGDDRNSWKTKVGETLPDGNTNTVYTNAYGQGMLTAYTDTTTSQVWRTFTRYDSQGRPTLLAQPSAVTGADDTNADLLHSVSGNFQYLADSSGLITTFGYGASTTATSSTAGDFTGRLKSMSVQQGETGTAVPQIAVDYIKRTAGGVDFAFTADATRYRNTDGTGGEPTSYSYMWQGSTAQPAQITATLPVVTTAENGPGMSDTSTTVYDSYGRPVWTKDGAGYINYTEYDLATGAVTKTITDVDTTQASDFSNLPSGWSTPSGGGLHLKTLYEVDALGRTTKQTYPNGRVDYMVYNDANYEVRSYPGWDSTNNVPTGPTQVTRVDRAHSYTETLTMSATPSVSGGRPTGTESISSVQTLARDQYSAAGQLVDHDAYFNLSGITYGTSAMLGTAGTNYYRTQYGYNHRGLLNRTVTPTGTIYRIEYDGLNRKLSEWVGTNDTPASGYWSPSNNTSPSNMVEVREYQYDGSGVGDGNLTQMTEHPGGGAADRVTQTWFDWRDRAVAVKQGAQASEATDVNRPIFYRDYDNLSEVTKLRRYDGDEVSITVTGGVPQAPSSSLLRAQTVTNYDKQGRVYRTQVYSVDSSSGSVSTNALATDTWYDRRGLTIKTAHPGGLGTKTSYDGARRPTALYATDGGGDSSWSDASTVTGDAVLEQVEYQYDGDGNVLLTTTRQRFHDETATGALGNPTTTPKARVSYVGSYYDLADRPTATVNVGTNGGTAWTRPSSVPARSDTVLVTSQTYAAAGWVQDETDPKGLVDHTDHDNLGRVTKTVQDYTDGTPTDSSNKTVEYGYDGMDHQTSLTALLAGGGSEQTQWVFGVAGTISSNDLLKEMDYPDPTTGAASSSQRDQYTVNALGQNVTMTDRNGNVHTYTYDVLGRQTADAVTTLGTGVDGSVRRLEAAYDTQGNPYLFTSYDAASGGNVVNQVQQVYNGLGQLTQEYQSHSGGVNTSTTPSVQYAYTEMAGGANNSRLTSMTYPNDRVLNYNYASGLDSSISRLSSISDSSATLESYSYLGLDTVVVRSHPQPGVDLTYVKLSGESNGDAGDEYVGLDRFGRIVDQRWVVSSSGTATDRFQYGYDRNGNVLWRDNLVNSAFGELYTYDGLNQLTSFERGTLNSTKDGLTGSASRNQSWSFDALGNWTNVTTDGTAQTRGENKQNEITSVSGATTPGYDSNGNLTTDEQGHTLVYDAWNRLVQVKSGSTIVSGYGYDRFGRRVVETTGGTTRDLYYSAAWQVVEERVSGQTATQYVWSPVFVDALVARDRDTNGDGTLDERLYAQQDANWNVTALINDGGSVTERFIYDAYGSFSVLSSSWGSASDMYSWRYYFQGGRFDQSVGLYSFRSRDYSPSLGRWVQPDPMSYDAGDVNLYRSYSDSPYNNTDPDGTDLPGNFRDCMNRCREIAQSYLRECTRRYQECMAQARQIQDPDRRLLVELNCQWELEGCQRDAIELKWECEATCRRRYLPPKPGRIPFPSNRVLRPSTCLCHQPNPSHGEFWEDLGKPTAIFLGVPVVIAVGVAVAPQVGIVVFIGGVVKLCRFIPPILVGF